MAPQNKKSIMKDFRQSFRRKKDASTKSEKAKELENEEKTKLSELKAKLSSGMPSFYTDAILTGFLRARTLDVNEAADLVQLDMNVRKFLMLDEFMAKSEFPEVVEKFSIGGVIGFDKEGSLVRIINAGRGDSKGFVHCVSTIDRFRLFLAHIEHDRKLQEKENERTGRSQNQFVYILDLEEINMSKVMYKPALDVGILSLKLLQDHNHDLPKVVYVINAPPYYAAIYKLFKPVIQDSLQKKIRIFGVRDEWKEELLKQIDAEVLPAYLGGKRVDEKGDEYCKSFIGFGGLIPESYYLNQCLNPDDPDVVSVAIPAGSQVNYGFPMPITGSIIRWHIQAKENDIGIGLFADYNHVSSEVMKIKKKNCDLSKMEPITPIIRSQCHIAPEVGFSVSWSPGTVVVHLDNSYSWMNSKDVLFKITVEPPSAIDQKTVNQK